MVTKFLSKYFPPSMVTKLRNDISNFRQLPDSLFEAWERYKLSINRCPNHNMLPVTQIDTFYNGLTLRHWDTINAVAGGTFMKRRPEECVAGEWFKKDCIGSVTTWEDLVEKSIQKFYQLSNDNEEIEAEKDDDHDDITDIFKIEGNLFDYETPLCKAFNDFNYLLKIDRDLFTFDIQRIGTYKEYELNNHKEITKWPTCSLDIDRFCNGGELPGMVWVESMTYFQDHKWYDELADGKLKEESLMHKAKVEESWGNATPGVMKFYAWLINSFGNFHKLDYNVLVKLQECWWKINAHETAPFTRLESYGQKSYANIKTEKAYDLYLEDLAIRKSTTWYTLKKTYVELVGSILKPRQHTFSQELKLENHPEKHIRGVPRSYSISYFL
nr:reverse transcriptase domain-containing protein [Tanacetum cinerariifolium]